MKQLQNLRLSLARYYRRFPRLTYSFWFKIGVLVTVVSLLVIVPLFFGGFISSEADASDAHRNFNKHDVRRRKAPDQDQDNQRHNQVESPEGNLNVPDNADGQKHQLAVPEPVEGESPPNAVIDSVPRGNKKPQPAENHDGPDQRRNIPAPRRRPSGQLAGDNDQRNPRPENDKNKQVVKPPPKIDVSKVLKSRDVVGDNGPEQSQERNDAAFPTFKEDVKGDYEIDQEKREGPGEYGMAVVLASEEKRKAERGSREYGFNQVASDKVSLDRAIPDTRPEECKFWHYPSKLPKVSVVIAFHNEMWSTLLRTVHSVINRTPAKLLEEVLLVDDFSDKANLKKELDEYIERFNGKVRIHRNAEREGLIRTRSIGAKNAKGEVVFFLDAHCELGYNWLPPLLAPIARDRTIMTVPVIDGIESDSFAIHKQYQGKLYRGIFEWGLLYKETELPYREQKRRIHESEPYKSPTHAGGLFAINRAYFLELGGYDDGLQIWGGEQYELSFKIWQCGGSIEWVPCSHIGHIYRGFMPYGFGKLSGKGPIVTINLKRVAEVWMDEYKEYYYTREPLARDLDAGNISAQLALREKLQCKSFKWYMENVAYDVVEKYPLLPRNLFFGELRSVSDNWQCWDSGRDAPAKVGTSPCHHSGGHQLLRINAEGQLGIGERCVEVDESDQLDLIFCHMGKVDGPWEYLEKKKLMKNKKKGKCAEVQTDNTLFLKPCDSSKPAQQFEFHRVKESISY